MGGIKGVYGDGRSHSQRCKGCVYGVRWSGESFYCDYLTRVGKRRPCPPGDKCTERITARQLRERGGVPLDKAEAVKMWRNGVSVKEIAEYFSISRSYCYAILNEGRA